MKCAGDSSDRVHSMNGIMSYPFANCDAHTREELTVFSDFATACPLPLLSQTAKKQRPPAPDVLCDLQSGESLLFELVRTEDSEAIRRRNDALNLDRALEATYQEEVLNGRLHRPDRFNSHSVMVDFEPTASMRARRNAIPMVIECLSERGPGRHIRRLPRPIKLLYCYPNGSAFEPPHIFCSAACHVASCVTRRIMSKIQSSSKYKSSHGTHLLAWANRDFPSSPIWRDELADALWQHGTGRFERVWVYDLGNSMITFDSAIIGRDG
jgi:hypothetical protein